MSKIKSISGMAIMLLLAACSAEGQQAEQGRNTDKSSRIANVPAPSHVLEGRNLVIHMPYRRAGKQTWVAGNRAGETGPFRFIGSNVVPDGAGPGVDIYTVSYEATQPGSAAMRFALVPAGKTLVGPKKTVFEGTPTSEYTAEVTVTQ
jgi:hypothetical protein